MLPDYEIKEWNEQNFDINSCSFVKEAYENKKWAFVSDYVRIYALYNEGGIYFDTDMKVIKDVSNIVDKEMFLGYEDTGYVGTAVIGVKEKNNKYIKEILDYYNEIKHFNPEIMYNYANPVIITRILKKYKSYKNDDGIRIFDNNIYIYPRDYFYPLSYNYSEKVYTENTCMVHLFNATWTDRGEKRTIGVYRKFGPELGKTINKTIDGLFNLKNRIIIRIKKIYNWARMKYSIYINRNKRVNKITNELSQMNEKYVVICHPEMTEQIDSIKTLFKNNILFLREQYTQKEASLIAKSIIESDKDTIIFNSYADGWDKLISELKMQKRNLKIKALIHGGQDSLANSETWNHFNTLLSLYDKEYIDEFGIFKKSLYDFYKQKDYRVKLISKYAKIDNKEEYKADKKHDVFMKIGLYKAYDGLEKNVYNELSAISLLENVKLDCAPMNYKISQIARKYNINLCGASGNLNKEELYKKMADNDINLCITTIDESLTLPLESLELGTVCLVGENCEYFENSELYNYLVVKKEDSIIQIADKIRFAVENREKILELYKKWKEKYMIKVNQELKEFLS